MIKLLEVLYLREQSIYDDVNSKTQSEHLNSEAEQSQICSSTVHKVHLRQFQGNRNVQKKGIMQ